MPEPSGASNRALHLVLILLTAAWLVALAVAWCADAARMELGYVLVTRATTIAIGFLVALFATGVGMQVLRLLRLSPLPLPLEALYGAATGLYFLAVFTLLLGLLGAMIPGILYATLAVGAILSRRPIRSVLGALIYPSANAARPDAPNSSHRGFRLALCVLAVCVLVMMLLGAFVPPMDYDALEYHLGLPARFYRLGRIVALPDHVFASFPQNVEMLYLAGMILGGGVMEGAALGKLFNVLFVAMAAVGTYALGRYALGSPLAGFAAGCAVAAMPAAAQYASMNVYMEPALLLYFVIAILALTYYVKGVPSDGLSPLRWIVLAGLATGLAVGCKYSAVIFLAPMWLLVIALVGVFRVVPLLRAAAHAAVFSGVTLLVFAPWAVRNWVSVGNPVHPFLYSVFGSAAWSTEQANRFAQAHRSVLSLAGVGPKFWEAVLQDRGASLLALAFLPLFPLADGRKRATLALTAFFFLFLVVRLVNTIPPESAAEQAAVAAAKAVEPWLALGLFLTPLLMLPQNGGRSVTVLWGLFVAGFFLWYVLTHQAPRFLFPLMFVPILLSALGLATAMQTRFRGPAKVVFFIGLLLCAAMVFFFHLDGMPVAIGLEQRDEYLLRNSAGTEFSYEAMQYLNELPDSPAGGAVMFVGEAQTFYCRRPVIATTVFDTSPLVAAHLESGGEPARMAHALRERGVGYLFVNWMQIERQEATYHPKPDLTTTRARKILKGLLEGGHLKLMKAFDSGQRKQVFEIYALAP